MQIGDKVRVLPPFDQVFPGEWVITGVNAETGAFQIDDGKDFDAAFLEQIT